MADTKLTALTEDTALSTDDLIYTVNNPGGTPASRKATIANFLKIINSLTEDTAPDRINDYLISYDASAAAAKKVALRKVGTWTNIIKTADQAVQSDVTLSADSDLIFSTTSGLVYAIRGKVWFTTPAAADFKYRFRMTTAPTLLWVKHKYTAPLATSETEQAIENIATPTTSTTTISVLSAGAVTDPGYIEFEARLVSLGGSFTIDWAQVTSTASDTSVKSASYFEYAIAS